jgi:hypothetical protein
MAIRLAAIVALSAGAAAQAPASPLDTKLQTLERRRQGVSTRGTTSLAAESRTEQGVPPENIPRTPPIVSLLYDHVKAEMALHDECAPFKGAPISLDSLQCQERAAVWALESARTKAKAQQMSLAEMQTNSMFPCYNDFGHLYECMDDALKAPTLAKLAREVDATVHSAWVWAYVANSVSAKVHCVATHDKDKNKAAVCITSKLSGTQINDPLA